MKKLFLALCFISVSSAHTLEEIYTLLKGFGSVAAAHNQALAANAQANAAKASYYPQISLDAGAVFNTPGVELLAPSRALRAAINTNWLIFDGVRDAGVKSAQTTALLAEAKAKTSLLDARLNAAKSYYQRIAISKAMQAANAECTALMQASDDVQKLVAAGLKSDEEASMLQAAFAECKASVAKLNASALMLDAALSALTGTQIEANAINSTSKDKVDELALALNKLHNNASNQTNLDNNPAITQANLFSQLASEQVSAAKGAFYPKVFLKHEADFTDSRLRLANFGPLAPLLKDQIKPHALHSSVQIGFSVNLFSGLLNKRTLEAARLNELAAKELQSAAKSKANAELKAIEQKITAEQDALQAAILSNQAATAAANSISKKYKAGLLSYSDLLRALAKKASSSALIAQQEAALASAIAERSYVLGEIDE